MSDRFSGRRKKDVAELSGAALEIWGKHFDRSKTSIKAFLQAYTIPTKRAGSSGSVLVDFVERPAQTRLRECIEAQWRPHDPEDCPAGRDGGTCREGHGAKVLILKDRQQGISTFMQGLLWERIVRGGGGNGAVVSHKDEATEMLFETLDHFKGQVPDGAWAALHPAWGEKTEECAGIDRSNVRQIKLRLGPHLSSSIRVYTAGDKALGRGGAIRFFHISEYPWWERGKSAVGGMLESWDDAPGNFVVFESTANGREEFYQMWVKAQEKRNEYACLFYSWLDHPLKVRKLPSRADYREPFINSIGKDTRYGVEDELLLVRAGATHEQLWWRRKKIDSPEVNGDLGMFRQEHPANWREAFQSSSYSVYPLHILESWEPASHRMEADAWVGELVDNGEEIVFQEKSGGKWAIYRQPEVGCCYGFGADPASGKVVQYDGRTEADFATMQIRGVLNKHIVAMFQAHIEPEDFAVEVVKASRFYGRAKGFVERNDEYGGTVIRTIVEMGEEALLLAQELVVPTTTGKMQTSEFGFRPRNASKAAAVDLSKSWVYELGLAPEGAVGMIPFRLLDEMTRFERLRPSQSRDSTRTRMRLGAKTGHDDLVSADYLCHEALKILEWEVSKLSKVMPRKGEADLYFELLYQSAMAIEPERRTVTGLGRMF